MKTKITLLLTLLSFHLYAQFQDGLWTGKEAYNWYFGVNAGLNFNTTPPTTLSDSQMGPITYYYNSQPYTIDPSSSSISDAQGNLLFYTDGNTVWNKEHDVMENGTFLIAASELWQSVMIIKAPGNNLKYYIIGIKPPASHSIIYPESYGLQDPFTTPMVVYSEVDMGLNNGLGAVTANKNIPLAGFGEPTYARITATHHADGNQIWVMIHNIDDNVFKAFLVSEGGINMQPVISQIGFRGSDYPDAVGQMKFSPDGTMISKTYQHYINQRTELFGFNNATGQVTNLIATFDDTDFINEGEWGGIMGLEFSPNSRYLYMTGFITGFLKQFDIKAGTEAQIKASAVTLHFSTEAPFVINNMMQLGPDGKIYMGYGYDGYGAGVYSIINHHTMNVINYPNNPGLSSGFEIDAIDLITGKIGSPTPTFVQSYLASGILHEGDCTGLPISFSTIRIPDIQSISWDFGDPESGQDNTSSEFFPSHVYNNPGTYSITALITSNNAQQTATLQITVTGARAIAPQSALLSKCSTTGTAVFNLTQFNTQILDGQNPQDYTLTYFASQADLDNNIPITNPQDYTTTGGTIVATVTNNTIGCQAVVSFVLVVNPVPVITTLQPLNLCGNTNGSITLNLTQFNTQLLGSQNPNLYTFTYFASQQALDSNNPIANPLAYVTTSGQIFVSITNNATGCQAITSFTITVNYAPVAISPDITAQCANSNGSITINLTDLSATILNGQDPALFSVSYYDSQANLDSNNAIVNPQNFSTAGGSVFAKVLNTITGCNTIISFIINVLPAPALTEAITTEGCAPFNLTAITQQAAQGLSVSYYTSLEDAESETNAIGNIQDYSFTGNTNTLYLVLENLQGCKSIEELQLKTGNCNIPKGISPNGDTLNDSFDLTSFQVTQLSIYNRYGLEVYSQGNYTNEWQGQGKSGSNLPTGTYYYSFSTVNGENKTGWVYINREN